MCEIPNEASLDPSPSPSFYGPEEITITLSSSLSKRRNRDLRLSAGGEKTLHNSSIPLFLVKAELMQKKRRRNPPLPRSSSIFRIFGRRRIFFIDREDGAIIGEGEGNVFFLHYFMAFCELQAGGGGRRKCFPPLLPPLSPACFPPCTTYVCVALSGRENSYISSSCAAGGQRRVGRSIKKSPFF